MGAATSDQPTIPPALPPRSRFSLGLRLATLAALGATLAPLGARQWWVLELTTHFTPYVAIGLAVVAAGCLWGREWRGMAVCLACLAWHGALLAPLYLAGPECVEAANIRARPLRILAQNVLTQNRNYAAVLELVGQEKPDVLVLIETNEIWLWEMAPLDAAYPHQLRAPSPGNFGITLYSGLPLESAEVLRLGAAELPSLTAVVQTEQGPLRLLATHTLPPIGATTAHLRNDQLSAIAEWVASSDLPTLVVGDLNITPWSPMFHDLLTDGRLRNTQRGYGVSPTWYARGLVGLPIDHALVTEGVGVLDRRIGPAVGSDHRAVVVDLVVTRGERESSAPLSTPPTNPAP